MTAHSFFKTETANFWVPAKKRLKIFDSYLQRQMGRNYFLVSIYVRNFYCTRQKLKHI